MSSATVYDAIDAFALAIEAAGITPPEHIAADGRLHRFSSNGKSQDDAGWYVLYTDGAIPAGAYGDWRTGVCETWCSRRVSTLTPAEREAHHRQVESARSAAAAERAKEHKSAAARAQAAWDAAAPAPADHPYLAAKSVLSHGLRVDAGGTLLVPMCDAGGGITSVQRITGGGEKRYTKGGAVAGARYVIGEIAAGGWVVVCEGYATGASILEATGIPVVVAFSAGNLSAVASSIRALHPAARIIVAGDNDDSGTGQRAAQAAAQAASGLVAIPPGPGDWNDVAAADGAEAVRAGIDAASAPVVKAEAEAEADEKVLTLVSAADLLSSPPPPPVDFVIGGLPSCEIGLLNGSDGVGKSMLLVEFAVAVACGIPVAGGAISAPPAGGRVVYVSGEDGIDHIHRRLIALRGAMWDDYEAREKYEEGARRLELVALNGERMPLVRAGRQDDEPRPVAPNIDALLRAADGARLLIIDPLVMFHGANENDNGHMDVFSRLLIRLARQIGCGIIAAHHTGQEALLTARDDHQAGRGATALAAAARAVWVLRGLTKEEVKRAEESNRDPLSLRVLRGSKVSRARRQPGVLLTMGEDGVLAMANPLPGGGHNRQDRRRRGGGEICARNNTAAKYAEASASRSNLNNTNEGGWTDESPV